MKHKIHWDFEIQIYHLILSRSPDFVLIYKKQKKLSFSKLGYFRLIIEWKWKKKMKREAYTWILPVN